ncbi:hypothetical protein Ancab_008267 [Ancistrocladus abbreviatus]
MQRQHVKDDKEKDDDESPPWQRTITCSISPVFKPSSYFCKGRQVSGSDDKACYHLKKHNSKSVNIPLHIESSWYNIRAPQPLVPAALVSTFEFQSDGTNLTR